MDRDTAIIIAVTTIVLTLIGGIYLGQPSTSAELLAQETFSTEDIRYKYQQAELKRGKKKAPPPADYATTPESSENEAPQNDESAGDDGTNDESAEEPPID
ncbi:MAG: hypothetical protein HOP13_06420 [Alphaproteobacteria bacterium]|nr:hypothetical protein [Alphaproteobacteria bacterium]